jgi:protein TonB
MAYVDQTARRPSLRIGLAVGVLHLGVGAALLTTFAGGAITTVIHRALDANDWTYVPPPPPGLCPNQSAAAQRASACRHTPPLTPKLGPATPLEPVAPFTLPPIGDGPLVSPSGGPATLPTPEPLPSARPPRSAPSAGNPGDWVSRNDYPGQAVREGWEGVTRFRLTIGRDGRVADCAVTGSSGHDLLDATACARIRSRARFSIATDETGAATTGVYLGSIRWQLDE